MTLTQSKPATKQWTKKLVQEHAQTAVKVELYTLPFYLTAMASIKDKKSDAYKSILSICIEEMLHLQLAANLCIALDTQPIFIAPKYGTSIPYLKPDDPATGHHKLINAKLDALNQETLGIMLDIETPSGLEEHRHPEEATSAQKIEQAEHPLEKRWNMDYHSTPQYPYSSIGEMYNALMTGIKQFEDEFSWNTTNQQQVWDEKNEKFKQIITSFDDAEDAVKTISLQGEGTSSGKDKFMVPPQYRLEDETDDAHGLNEYSHYERLLKIKKQSLPGTDDVYEGINDSKKIRPQQQEALQMLQSNFAKLLNEMNTIWNINDVTPDNSNFWPIMYSDLLPSLRNCWINGVIPKWS